MSEKIGDRHLGRKALVYVRQSSAFQVTHYRESRRLQYAMVQRTRALGWRDVEVVDEDLGKSAAGSVERKGFERMVADVSLGKVGAVAAREVSRFARNSRDWQQLIEVCRLVDTLLLDQESVYDPRNSNDRLLLGLKGSLNEYELDLLRQRSVEARQQKARRGELLITAPVGYLKMPDQRMEKNPNRRVQQALLLLFDKFLELGTVRQAMMWFIEQGLQLPAIHHGPKGWETIWKRPCYRAALRILRNPVYAGAYGYGKTEITSAVRDGRLEKGLVRKPMNEWSVLIHDHHEAYISRERFERIQEMISKNSHVSAGPGAAKRGPALLAGLLRCRRCSRKLSVRYTGRDHDVLRYVCIRGHLDQGEQRCITFGGLSVDEAFSHEILQVLGPGAIQAAVRAGQEEMQKQDEFLRALELELEATHYEADRVRRQYDGAEPENRLVVDELERRWNRALEKVRQVEARLEEARGHRTQVSLPDPDAFADLKAEVNAVWNDPATDVRLKKRIVRTLIEEVIADVDAQAGEVVLLVHWKGGLHSEMRLRRRRRGESKAHTPNDTVDAIRILTLICTDDYIAGALNRNGLRTGRGNRWIRERVASLRVKRKIPAYSKERKQTEGWMTLTEAASFSGVSSKTLRRAAERGDVPSMHPLPDGPWIFKSDHLKDPAVRGRLKVRMGSGADPAGQDPAQLSLCDPTTFPGGAV